jgi:holo-[acyl-carrier-protein] synthase
MVVGTGVDIVDISRIERILESKKEDFFQKVFTLEEVEYIKSKGESSQTVSGIFASKEAVSKVLGCGIGKVSWKDIEILHDDKNKPYVNLLGNGKIVSYEKGVYNIHISLTHERDYAVAVAIGEGIYKEDYINVPEEVKNLLLKRENNTHKGSYGRVGIVAGSKGMTGACYLSTMASLRSGSGLVYAIVPDGISNILSIKITEGIIKPVEDNKRGHFVKNSIEDIKRYIDELDAFAIGPGIGVDKERVEVVSEILDSSSKKIAVVDADGLNCCAYNMQIFKRRKSPTIITPHPGEMSRLLRVSIKDIQKDRIEYARYFSRKYNVVTVLKGFNTVVSSPEGEVYVNTTGNPGMATAGSGDVLTGVILSFVGQGIKPYLAAILGVFVHGLAGDLAKIDKGEYGMIASDIIEKLPYGIKNINYYSKL